MKYYFVGTKVHINQYITKTFCDILFSIRALIPPSTTHCTPFFTPFSSAFKRHAQHPCAEKHALLPRNLYHFADQQRRFYKAIHALLHGGVFRISRPFRGSARAFSKLNDRSEGLRGLFSKLDDHSEGRKGCCKHVTTFRTHAKSFKWFSFAMSR